jgi:dipeptidyl aminopeptidase/acylaminoacyl peptidase
MTTEPFGRRLSAWLEEDARGRVADHLTEVLVATRATRQRPAWSSIERWLPMTSIAAPRPFVPRTLLVIAMVAALLAALGAGLLLLQVGKPSLPPFGGAGNGRIVYVDGNAVRSAAADGSDVRTIATATRPGAPVISPDGALVAYIVDEAHVEVAPVTSDAAAPAGPISIVADGMRAYALPTWSPDGRRVAFIAADPVSDHVFVANRNGTEVHQVGADAVAAGYGIGWIGFSPNGRWLAIADGIGEGPDGQIQLVDLNAGGFRTLATPPISFDDGSVMAWSPDPSTPRILYLSKAGQTRYYDLTTDKDVSVASGFWPSWSPTGDRIAYWSNGTKVIQTPTSVIAAGRPVEIFPSFGDCADHPEMAGKAICGPVTWSPDGERVIGTEVTGNGLLSLRSDGLGDPVFVDLQNDLNLGAGNVVTWQPVLKRS